MPLEASARKSVHGSRLPRLTVCLWLIVCGFCCVRAYCFPTSHTVYHNYAAAGRGWLAGGDAYDLARDEHGAVVARMSGYRYSPLVSAAFVPLSMLPDSWGGALWRLVNYLGFIGAFAWFVRAVLPGARDLGADAKAWLWLLLLPLALGSMNNGQANVLVMAFLLAAGAAVMRERWNVAAIVLAGACLLKIYPLAVALLMIVIFPRKLGWRFALALVAGLALPFLLQRPGYVLGQYDNWLQLLLTDDRRDFPLTQGYRDFYLLTRFFGAPMIPIVYMAVQLLAAGVIAGVCLAGRLAGWPQNHLVQTTIALGCCWMVVLGPSTESSTFILIAPALAWALVDAFALERPRWAQALLATIMAMFVLTFTATWFPGGRDWFYILQPIAALLFLVERLLSARPDFARVRASELSAYTRAA